MPTFSNSALCIHFTSTKKKERDENIKVRLQVTAYLFIQTRCIYGVHFARTSEQKMDPTSEIHEEHERF